MASTQSTRQITPPSPLSSTSDCAKMASWQGGGTLPPQAPQYKATTKEQSILLQGIYVRDITMPLKSSYTREHNGQIVYPSPSRISIHPSLQTPFSAAHSP